MARTKRLHAVFDGEVLRPEAAVDLEPNARYLVTIERKEEKGEQQNLWDVLSAFSGTVEDPEDWSKEHEQYLYGTPRRARVR